MVRQLRVSDERRVHSQPLERYVDYPVSAKLAEGCSPRYGEWLRDKIGTFVRWLERESGQAPFAELAPGSVRRFIINEQSRPRWENHPWRRSEKGPVSPPTIRATVRALRILS